MNKPNEIASTEDFEFAALSEAENYRHAIVNEFSPFLNGRIMEIGAGIGQISEAILDLPTVSELVGVEPDRRFQKAFRERLPEVRLVEGTAGDLVDGETFDGAVMVNVLEHIEHDLHELKLLHGILKPTSGHLCLLVPARRELYSDLDSHFGHFRRYSRKDLKLKLSAAGFVVQRIYYFNFIGYFAWLIRFRLMHGMNFDIKQVRFFDRRLLPLGYWAETRILRPPIGQSIIAIAKAL